MYGALARTVDLVFYCESEEDAVALVKMAQSHNVCLVPYGGGTSVSGALLLPAHEPRMIDHQLRQVMMDNGGSISHHHGVGKIRKDFLPQLLSPASIARLKQTKQAVDPQNICGIHNSVCAE